MRDKTTRFLAATPLRPPRQPRIAFDRVLLQPLKPPPVPTENKSPPSSIAVGL
ncbi:hypothetical protein Csa_016688 [Cucumis sativus]|uniref:Uncharacterized protein n=1 Tax=Cucumis sativus TaxID=3659 RepID=A0A0A0K754_CUCSA|nr:hypothetical protein Csa_016688 [Cucumis sativus]